MREPTETNPSAAQFDKLPPHSLEAERCVLASMMLDKESIATISQVVGQKDAFYQVDHQIIYEMLVSLYSAGRPIDPVLLREELRKKQMLDEVGGTAYLAEIINSVPSAAHGMHYAQIVREKGMLRQLITASNEILKEAYGTPEDAKELVDAAEKKIFNIAQAEVRGTVEPIHDTIWHIFDMVKTGQSQRGIESGFFDLDEMLDGLHGGEMIIIAARPSMGKTAFAMNVIESLAVDQGKPCGVFSLEMSRQQLCQRLVCSAGRIDAARMRKMTLDEQDKSNLANAAARLAAAPMFVDDQPGLTIMDLRAKARRLKREHDIQCLMIDYMQLMDNPGPESRQQQITEISRGIKAVARDLNIPVLALSQLNRASEGRDGHRPRMSDLRESGSIEQDADVVMLLHREDYYLKDDPSYQPTNVAEVIIAKQRNGPTGTVELMFDGKYTRFQNKSAMESAYT